MIMKNLLSYGFKYIFQYKLLYGVYLLSQILLNFFNLVLPILEGFIVDCLVRLDINSFKYNISILMLIMLLSLLLSGIGSFLYFKIQVKCGNAANLDEIQNLYNISFLYLLDKDPSELNQAINNDSNSIIIFCLNSVHKIIITSLSLLLIVYVVLKQSYVFALIIIISNAFNFLIYFFYKNKLYEVNKAVLESSSDYFGIHYQFVYYLKSIKMCSLYENMINVEEKVFNKFFRHTKRRQLLECNNNIFIGLVSCLAQLFIYIVGFIFILHGKTTIGMIITISNYCSRVLSNSQEILEFGNEIQSCKASYDRLKSNHIFHAMRKNKKVENITTIIFDKFSFKYPGHNELFCYTGNFEIGNIYRIMGNNGVGKSTFIQLFLGIYGDDYTGNVLLNKISMKDIDVNYFVKNNVSICLQEPFIMEDTLENNFIPNKNYKFENLQSLLQGFDLDNLISNLDNGLQSVLYPLNIGLSGGEKQKINIIRVLLSSANILIFDEPTSSLDKKSALFFQNYIKGLKDKIIIIISHDDLEILDEYTKLVYIR